MVYKEVCIGYMGWLAGLQIWCRHPDLGQKLTFIRYGAEPLLNQKEAIQLTRMDLCPVAINGLTCYCASKMLMSLLSTLLVMRSGLPSWFTSMTSMRQVPRPVRKGDPAAH
jgi:hypothetical protein